MVQLILTDSAAYLHILAQVEHFGILFSVADMRTQLMRNDVLAVLGSSVRQLRQERQLSTAELARTLNISSRELDEVESARTAIRLDQLVGLSSALNVPLLRLFLSDELPTAEMHP